MSSRRELRRRVDEAQSEADRRLLVRVTDRLGVMLRDAGEEQARAVMIAIRREMDAPRRRLGLIGVFIAAVADAAPEMAAILTVEFNLENEQCHRPLISQ